MQIAGHSLRIYTDHDTNFNKSRDNPTATGCPDLMLVMLRANTIAGRRVRDF